MTWKNVPRTKEKQPHEQTEQKAKKRNRGVQVIEKLRVGVQGGDNEIIVVHDHAVDGGKRLIVEHAGQHHILQIL